MKKILSNSDLTNENRINTIPALTFSHNRFCSNNDNYLPFLTQNKYYNINSSSNLNSSNNLKDFFNNEIEYVNKLKYFNPNKFYDTDINLFNLKEKLK